MAAPIGNEYYKLRTKDGRDKQYDTVEAFADACDAYFQWCLDNPFQEEHIINKPWVEIIEVDVPGEDGEEPTKKTERITHPYFKATTNKMRPFTLEGLCNHLDLSVEGFKLYEKRKDFVGVTTRARQIIDNQQFEGASAGFLNANIIARKLGLIDKKEISDVGIKPIEFRVITKSEPKGKK